MSSVFRADSKSVAMLTICVTFAACARSMICGKILREIGIAEMRVGVDEHDA